MILPNLKQILVVDLEIACFKHKPENNIINEIIEIGITTIDNNTLSIIDTWSSLIKPKKAYISEFCTNFTGITQKMVNEQGIEFSEAIKIIIDKFHPYKKVWYSWGDFDMKILNKISRYNKLKNPFNDKNHLDGQLIISSFLNSDKELSLQNAMKTFSIQNKDKVFHRAGPDSRNTAEIIVQMYKQIKRNY